MEAVIRVSVVIPVWNPGEGVLRCIRQLRDQTLKEIEVIFVDDRGTDEAMDHIRAAAAEDPRLRILVNPQNMGPGYARNAGIEAARGEYVGFVDPDDYPAPDYLERLYRLAVREDLDIAKGRIVYLREDGTPAPHQEQNQVIRAGLAAGKPPYAVFTYEHHSAIYRREMLLRSGARYGMARRAQDTTFLLRSCHAARSLDLDDGAEYYFCERGNSAMHVFSLSSLDERLFSFREQVDYLASALGEDRYAPAYANALFLSNLRFYNCYEPTPEREEALRAYCQGMRQQVLRLPFAPEMGRSCYPVRALLDHGVLLPATPGYLPWEQPDARRWLGLLDLWTEHLLRFPEEAPSASYWVLQIGRKAELAGRAEGQEAEIRRQVQARMDRLPAGTRAQLRTAAVSGSAFSRLPKPLRSLLRKLRRRP